MGDSLIVEWAFGTQGPADYVIALRVRGDSAAGTWAGVEGDGTLGGRRTGP